MFLSFLVSIIGFTIINRQLRIFSTEYALSYTISLIIYAVISAMSILMFMVVYANPINTWLFFGIFLITVKFFVTLFRRYVEKRLEERIPLMIDSILVGVSSGKSLRLSFSLAIENEQGWMSHHWKEVLKAIEIEGAGESLESLAGRGFYRDMLPIFQATNKQRDQLLSLRKQHAMKINFRRKSGQITANLRWQSFIMTTMYAFLLYFVVTNFGFLNHRPLILSSIFIFVVGILATNFIGRSMKWKV